MKKNIYLIIITIITVVCIIAGSLYHIGGFALGLFDDSALRQVSRKRMHRGAFSR